MMDIDDKTSAQNVTAVQSNFINEVGANPERLFIALFAIVAALTGCGQPQQTAEPAMNNNATDISEENQQPMGHVMEFEGFTLRANVIHTDDLDASMAQQYGIEPEPDFAMLNVVVLEKQADQQPETVWAVVTVLNESLVGRQETIEMRPIETLGDVSFVGILDTSSQQIFRLDIKVQPAGTEQQLQMNFEVRLDRE